MVSKCNKPEMPSEHGRKPKKVRGRLNNPYVRIWQDISDFFFLFCLLLARSGLKCGEARHGEHLGTRVQVGSGETKKQKKKSRPFN